MITMTTYILPKADLLEEVNNSNQTKDIESVKDKVLKINELLADFNIVGEVKQAITAPSITDYQVQLGRGQKVSKLLGLEQDIALKLNTRGVNIAPRDNGLIGIQVNNLKASTVSFKSVIENRNTPKNVLDIPLGVNVSGEVVSLDLTKAPHLLVSGATGSGKSVFINSIINTVLMQAQPEEVKLLLVDAKRVEFNLYNGLPHLMELCTDPKKANHALNRVVAEMDRRYNLFLANNVKDIKGFNKLDKEKLPYILVVIDELSDLMMTGDRKSLEANILRLAQLSRACGIHMVLATQRPTVDIITGNIKANIPSRVAFSVASTTDSRTILDESGAENLLGNGGMIVKTETMNERLQGAYITDNDIMNVVSYIKKQMPIEAPKQALNADMMMDSNLLKAVEYIQGRDFINLVMLQKHLSIGFNKAYHVMDDLIVNGYVSEKSGLMGHTILRVIR